MTRYVDPRAETAATALTVVTLELVGYPGDAQDHLTSILSDLEVRVAARLEAHAGVVAWWELTSVAHADAALVGGHVVAHAALVGDDGRVDDLLDALGDLHRADPARVRVPHVTVIRPGPDAPAHGSN